MFVKIIDSCLLPGPLTWWIREESSEAGLNLLMHPEQPQFLQ